MPSGICKGCGRLTNSTLSDWWLHGQLPKSYFENYPKEEGFATKCYLAWDDEGNPVRGCAYDQVEEWERKLIDEIIKKGKEIRFCYEIKKGKR